MFGVLVRLWRPLVGQSGGPRSPRSGPPSPLGLPLPSPHAFRWPNDAAAPGTLCKAPTHSGSVVPKGPVGGFAPLCPALLAGYDDPEAVLSVHEGCAHPRAAVDPRSDLAGVRRVRAEPLRDWPLTAGAAGMSPRLC